MSAPRNLDADCSECSDTGYVQSSRWWDEDADAERCPRRGCSAVQELAAPCALCAHRYEYDAPASFCAECNALLCHDCGEFDLRDWVCPQCVADARARRTAECSE